MARRKNTKRIDPRYFLNETTYRDLEEGGTFHDEIKRIEQQYGVSILLRDDEGRHGVSVMHRDEDQLPGEQYPNYSKQPVSYDNLEQAEEDIKSRQAQQKMGFKEEKKEKYPGLSPHDDRGAHDHRHRDTDGKPIGKNVDVFGRVVKDDDEPEDATNEGDSFSDHSSLTNSIRDAIIGHLENEKSFEMGALPQSVIRAIENSALRIADTMDRAKRDEYDPADSPFTRPKAARHR